MQRRLADQDALSAKKVAEFEQRSVPMLAQPCHDRIRMRFGFTGVPITTERTRSDVTLTQLQIAPTADARRTHAETFGSFLWVAPPETAARTRMRRSTERNFDISADLHRQIV